MPANDSAAGSPSGETRESVTLLLGQVREGEPQAWDRIYALLYQDLHQLARMQLRRHRGAGASPTSLVSDAWLKLADAASNAENRAHLVGLMARAMRYAILDESKRRLAGKRGAQEQHFALDEIDVASPEMDVEELLQLDQALKRLAAIEPRLETLVGLRYFGGLDDREIGLLLGISERTVRRDWLKARGWLYERLNPDAQ